MSSTEIDNLLERAERLPDPESRVLVRELATAMIALIAEGLQRVTALAGDELARKLADDPLVGSLLVLCDQHPDPPAVRAERSLRDAGVKVMLVETVGNGLRVHVSGDASQVEAIVASVAPDIDGVEIVEAPVLVPTDRLTRDRVRLRIADIVKEDE